MMAVSNMARDAPARPDHFFWQSGDLSQALQLINQSSPAALTAGFELLITPATFSAAAGTPIPLFKTLSVSQQICVILSLRANPSRFPKNASNTLQELVRDSATATSETNNEAEETAYLSIIRTLVGSERPPPCPEFLYTSSPAFPWAPELCTQQEAAIRKKNAAAAAAKTQAAAAAAVAEENQAMEIDNNINVDTGSEDRSKLLEAQACIRAELTTITTNTTTTFSASCLAAFDIVFNAVAAIGFSQQPQSLSLKSINNISSTDPLEASGLRNTLPDDLVLLITTATVTPSSSYSRCTTVARTILLPAVMALDAPPTQSLTAAAQHLGENNPKALIEHCWIPFITMAAGGSAVDAAGAGGGKQKDDFSFIFNRHHAEFIMRSIKQGAVPIELLYLIIDAIVQIVQYWNDHVIALVQGVLDSRPAVPLPTTPTINSLAASMLHAGSNSNFKGSIKLAKVLLTFVKGYGKQLSAAGEAIEQCRRAAQSIGTFMMKPTLAALDAAEKMRI